MRPTGALRDLGNAFGNFLKRPDRFRWPKFKTKHGSIQSFTLTGAIKVGNDGWIALPTFGRVRLKERGYLPIGRHILSSTVTKRAGRWFVSVGARKRIETQNREGGKRAIVGVDWGISNWLVISNGTAVERPRRLKQFATKLRRIQRSLSRKRRGSSNRHKTILRMQRLYMRIADIRRDALHKVTTMLTKTKSVIVMEDLAVANMTKNHKVAGAILDAAPGEFQRQLEYKTAWYGCRLVVARRNYPSTKICSRCQNVKKEMSLSERVYRCEACGLVIDRDLNAALNLGAYHDHDYHDDHHRYGNQTVADSSSETLNACKRREVTGPRGPVPASEVGSVEWTS